MPQSRAYSFIVSPVAHDAKLDFRCEKIREGTTEFDTVTCNHCNTVFHVRPGEPPDQMGGFCRQCMKIICPRCVGQPCTPFLKQMEEIERKNYIRRQYEMAMSA